LGEKAVSHLLLIFNSPQGGIPPNFGPGFWGVLKEPRGGRPFFGGVLNWGAPEEGKKGSLTGEISGGPYFLGVFGEKKPTHAG